MALGQGEGEELTPSICMSLPALDLMSLTVFETSLP